LQQSRWMIRRPAGCLGSNPIKPQSEEIEFVNEGINRPNRIVLIDPVLQVFRKQRRLLAIDPLNKAPHPIPRSWSESLLRESHEAKRFHTARVKNGGSTAASVTSEMCQ